MSATARAWSCRGRDGRGGLRGGAEDVRAVPVAREPDALSQAHLRLVAELAAGLVDREWVVRTEHLDAVARGQRLALRHGRDPLGDGRAAVHQPVRSVKGGALPSTSSAIARKNCSSLMRSSFVML